MIDCNILERDRTENRCPLFLIPLSMAKFGGEFIVRGGEIETLEGDFTHERVVVIAFPTMEAARSWYRSDDYADARDLRLKISRGDAVLAGGVPV